MKEPHIAVIGGGQLARMMQESASALGITLHALVETPDCATAQVVVDSIVGTPQELEKVEKICAKADVLTYEHEHIPTHVMETMARKLPVHPGQNALLYAQDKIQMRTRLSEAGISCPRFAVVTSPQQLQEKGDELGWPLVVKTPRGGYDGHGVAVVTHAHDVDTWWRDHDTLLAEQHIAFTREIAVLLARTPSGEIRHWDVVETRQKNGMCAEVIAPAQNLDPMMAQKAQDTGTRIAEILDVTGVLAVEMFVIEPDDNDTTTAPALYVNELAMRPHNSGHWTIDGAVTNQFEQHLRAVLDMPLGQTQARSAVTVMLNLLGTQEGSDPRINYPLVMKHFPSVKIHYYGKGVRPSRKIGHICLSGDDVQTVYEEAHRALKALQQGVSPLGDEALASSEINTETLASGGCGLREQCEAQQ
ncbi:MAG: 5-(carboxyamino)imidazole ribonucleotide synthase [Actinomycetaceae bacterium]|nr:5-(carboxyamino)imidazole ribonucleotide synthase [Actinomycetaceae bacterium]